MLVDIQANSGNTYRFIKEGPRNPENVSNPVKDVEDVVLIFHTRKIPLLEK
jgi:hypothetical protein